MALTTEGCGDGTKCGAAGNCVGAIDLFTCVSAGGRCWTDACGFLTNSGKAMRGLIIYDRNGRAAWQLHDPADSGFNVGAIVIDIDGVVPDEAYFEQLAKRLAQPRTESLKFKITAIQDGQLLTLTTERG